MFKKILIGIGSVLGVVVIGVLGYLGFLTLKEYKPEEIVNVEVENNISKEVKLGEELNIITSNIGYGGMDKDVHFFMDGGKMSRAISKERVISNTNNFIELFKKNKTDFVMFQEVDIDSTRSYKVNQYDLLKDEFNDYTSSFAVNYDVPWLALPLKEPHGKVLAGMVNISNREVTINERVALPIDETWPQRLAALDRAMLISRVSVENGKELVIINVHLSAYDKGGVIRRLQLEKVNEVIEKEYKKGNYVIIGGDWNQAIPGSDASKFETKESWPEWLVEIPDTFNPQGFSWKFDENLPTVRNAGDPYNEGYNFLSIIDGFMVSDNIEVSGINVIDTKFEYSDHNPVKMNFKLK